MERILPNVETQFPIPLIPLPRMVGLPGGRKFITTPCARNILENQIWGVDVPDGSIMPAAAEGMQLCGIQIG
jgi:hypothetical protein